MNLLYLDIETYSPLDLKTYGTHRYAEEAEVIMWQYAINDGPVIVENRLTPELRRLLWDESYTYVIHNSHFDRTVIRHATTIGIPVSKIFDTMACALAHGLPGGLSELCQILALESDKAKSREGTRLISMFCKPQKDRQGNVYRKTALTHPAEWEQFREYGRLDIEAMREVYKRLPKKNYLLPFERTLWELDQEINDRGVCIDLELANAALKAAARSKAKSDSLLEEETGGEVVSAGQRQAIIDFISSEYGIQLPDLRSSTVKKALKDITLPDQLQDLLKLRLDASKTSSSKYRRAVHCASRDGRLRGILQYCGASRTGRWAGRLFQPQNLPVPTIKGDKLDHAIERLVAGDNTFEAGTTMEVCSSALRGVIIAPPKRKLVIADLSNIEGRVLAWLADEKDKLKAYAAYDAGQGSDLYKVAYASAFGIPVEEVTAEQRQTGKVMELAFGFQGGVGAWITFATAFGINLEDMANKAWDSIPTDSIEKSRNFLDWTRSVGGKTHGLSDKAFIVCNSFKDLWREAHPYISYYWKRLEHLCKSAVEFEGSVQSMTTHKAQVKGGWLRVSLPSGRCIYYAQPQILDGKLSYMGLNQYTRKWSRISTYGGKLAENMTQATARDILAASMVSANKEGYKILLTTHDEIIAETPDEASWDAKGLETIMSTAPEWCADIPLAAVGFVTYRYRKG